MDSKTTLLCIHGAVTGAWVWTFWRRELAALGWEVNVLDLRGHGQSMPVDFATVTLDDYLWDIDSVVTQIAAARGRVPVLAGWSMGGTLALMYASKHAGVPGLFLLEPTPPVEVTGRPDQEYVRRFAGEVLGPEHLGVYPDDPEASEEVLFDLSEEETAYLHERIKGATEGGLAFRQNLRGVSIPAGTVSNEMLLVYGDAARRQETASTYRQTGIYFGAELLAVPDAGHWGVVLSEAAVRSAAPSVSRWLEKIAARTGE